VLGGFDGTNGAEPAAAPVMDQAGNLYGTTRTGGAAGAGTVYEFAPDGTMSVLHDFADGGGRHPQTSLLRDAQGDLFGVTPFDNGSAKGGTLYEVASDGSFHVLYQFTKSWLGQEPWGGLIEDAQGNLYGATLSSVFRYGHDGAMTVLHHFLGKKGEGRRPTDGLVMDDAGNLYGTTELGGATNGGTVYRLAPDGTLTTLWSFDKGHGPSFPEGGVLRDAKGNLTGTAGVGGQYLRGAVYRLAPDGTFSVLHAFGSGNDGEAPIGRLAADANGHLYGVTELGGTGECGGVFRVAPDGSFRTLYQFGDDWQRGFRNGCGPEAGLAIDASGNLYGTTTMDGAYRGQRLQGSLFRIDAR
jgi:uncharacterized repeat protein (TIGR03803 family)